MGRAVLLSDMTMHEDFVFINICVICYYEVFCGFLLQLNMDDKKYDIGKWDTVGKGCK